jgi:hypothetical protein
MHKNKHTLNVMPFERQERPFAEWYDKNSFRNISQRYATDIETLGYTFSLALGSKPMTRLERRLARLKPARVGHRMHAISVPVRCGARHDWRSAEAVALLKKHWRGMAT